MTRDYVRYVMASSQFSTQVERLRSGATIQHFGPTHLSQMVVVVPPLAEQTEITRRIDAAEAQLRALDTEARNAVVLLQERRSALISAAVTGQIDVRNAVPENAA